jgi:hypothetical protein
MAKGAAGKSTVVYLETVSDNPTRYYDGYQVSAAKDGSFHFADITPGTYRLTAHAFGFLVDAPQTITLRKGEKRKNVIVQFAPRTIICGRVTEDGKPKKTWASVYRYDPQYGTLIRSFFPSTEPDGSFSYDDLVPGTYFLQGYTTWYPGSLSFNGAKPIQVGASGPSSIRSCPYDIPLQYTGCHATSVSGRIASSGDPNQRYKILFLERNPAGGSYQGAIVMNINEVYKAGDNFKTLVCPNDFDVFLTDERPFDDGNESPGHKVIFEKQRLTVGDTPISDIVLTPAAMASIQAEVQFEGITLRDSCPGLGGQGVSILREGDGQSQATRLDDKNRFSFRNVAPGTYSIFLTLFSREAVFVKSILVDGKAIEGRRFTIAQPQPVTIAVTLSGKVSQAAGHLPPDLRREHRWEVAWTRPKGVVSGRITTPSPELFTVKLRSARYNSNASAEYSTHANPDGSFQFDKVDPGVYILRAESKSAITVEYGASKPGQRGTPIIVNRGAKLKNFTLAPPKLSSVCGHVTDNTGKPQPDRRIFIVWQHGEGNIYGDDKTSTATDRDGRFRVDQLAPRDYFIVTPSADRFLYFTPDGSFGSAQPITLRPGEDVGCTDAPLALQMPTHPEERHTISGKIASEIPAKYGDRFTISATQLHPSGAQSYVAFAKLDATHTFRLESIPNGRILIELSGAYGPEPMTWSGPYGPPHHILASTTVEVRGSDVSDLAIKPMQLPTVFGVAHYTHIPREWTGFRLTSESISLSPHSFEAPASATLDANGNFAFDVLDPGDYDLRLRSNGWYFRSVRLNGSEVLGRTIHLSSGISYRLEVEVSGDGARIDAHVVPDPALPRPEPPVPETCQPPTWLTQDVVLFPDPLVPENITDPTNFRPRLLFSTAVGTDHGPMPQFLGVPPGRYRAVAAEHLLETFTFLSFNFFNGYQQASNANSILAALAALGQPLTVESGNKLELTLPDKTLQITRLANKFGLPIERNQFGGNW